jgi:hypothetical protein
VFETAAPIQSPGKCEVHHIIPKTTIPEAVTEKLECRKSRARWVPGIFTTLLNPSNSHFNDAIRIPPVMTCFKWQAADFYDSGYRSWFQDLINVWKMPTTMLKNKVMYRQFIHSVAFVN